MSEELDLGGLRMEETSEGMMIVRSSNDKGLQKKFDDWFNEKGFTVSTKSESRKGKTVNWDSRKTARCWKFFIQGALKEDGRPAVRCLVCGDVLGHGGFSGPTPMAVHLKKGGHMKKAREMVYGTGSTLSGDPTEDEILQSLKKRGNEGLLISANKSIGGMDLPEVSFNQEYWNRYLLLGLLSALIPFNTLSNTEFRRVFFILRPDVKIPSVGTLTNLLGKEYEKTIEAIKRQIPSGQKVSIALDGWTSQNRLAITSVIMYYISKNWKLEEVQIAFEEVKGSHDGFNLATHLQSVLQRFGLDLQLLLGVTTDNASSNYSMTRNLEKILEDRLMEWSAAQNHIPCMTHVIQLALGAFMDCLGVKSRGKSWEDVEREKIAEESGRRKRIGGARVERVKLLPAGFNKIVEKQRLLAVVVNGSPKRRDDYLEIQRGKENIAVTLILDVKTRWNSTLAMLERAYRLKCYTYSWLIQYPQYESLFTTEDEWKAVEYVLQVLLPFRYWTLWMSKRRTITLHRVISIYNAIFDHLDSVLKALAKKKLQWKRDIHKAVRCARGKLKKYYSKVTPETGLILILATILDPFRKLQPFKSWDKEMGMTGDEPNSYERQYSDAFLEYWENNYVNNRDIGCESSGRKEKRGGSDDINANQGKQAPKIYGLESSEDEEEDLEVNDNVHSTPRTASRKSLLIQQARQYLANGRVHIQSWQHDYPQGDEKMADDPEEITASFWYPDVAGWWLKQETSMGDYRDLAKMARDIFSVMPHGVGVEASFSLGRDIISWRQSRTKGITLQQKVVVRQWARSNNGLLPEEVERVCSELDNNNDEKREKEDKRLNRLASVRDFLQFKEQSENLRSMQKRLKGKDVSISGLGYISDEDDNGDGEWSEFDDNGNLAFRQMGREKRAAGRNSAVVAVTTRLCYGNLVGRIRRIGTRMDAGLVGNTDCESDPAISESEAVWMLSESEDDPSDGEKADGGYGSITLDGKESDEEEEEEMEEDNEDKTPDNGLLIPGFRKVVRRSSRLELRKKVMGTEEDVQSTVGGQAWTSKRKRG